MSHSSLDENKFLELLDETVKGNEELICDYTFTSSNAICKLARSRGFKVMLSGMGADELCLGYPRHSIVSKYKLFDCFQEMHPTIDNR